MHIPDGYLDPSVCLVMYAVSAVSLAWALHRIGSRSSRSMIPTIAVSSAFVFVAQMLNFPIVNGTSGHLVGGTFLAMLLGPEGAMVGMTIVLVIEAFLLGDGGITTLGANAFNMAVIGAFSYYLVFLLVDRGRLRPSLAIFISSLSSVLLGALAASLELASSATFAPSGSLWIILSSMLFYHAIIGIGEGAITTALVTQLIRTHPLSLSGLNVIRGLVHEGHT